MSLADPRQCRATAPAIALLVLALTGCVSTQQRASRLHIENARIIAAQSPTVVTHPGRAVHVTGLSVVTSGGRMAFTVHLRNTTGRLLVDLPISIGLVRAGARRAYLNRGDNLDYFQSHVAAIAPHAAETWVFTGPRTRSAGAPFASVGDAASPPAAVSGALPRLRAALIPSPRHGPLHIRVTNLSGIPQIELQLYAVVGDGRHTEAAGSASVPSLATGGSVTVTLGLIGDPKARPVAVEAVPTLFQ